MEAARIFELTPDIYPHQEITGFTGEIYTDPSRTTFRTLALVSGLQSFTMTPPGQTRKSYMSRVPGNTTWYAIRNFFVGHLSRAMTE
jgi:hypothetical protein